MSAWINVKDELPPCKRNPNALGMPVLIWPRNPKVEDNAANCDGFCYYGKRATGKQAFYIFGAEVYGVTHWQRLPEGPK